MREVKVTLRGPDPEQHFLVDIATDVSVHDVLKDQIVRALGRLLGYALDPNQYRLNWQGSYLEPVFILEIVGSSSD